MAESKKSVYAAIVTNGGVAISKFVAAGFSGSTSMLTEGIHSVVDTGISALMLVGMHRSKKEPDATHPFGYAQELYFWTTVVALLLFSAGGGMSVLEGINRLIHPKAPESPYWNYGVLAIATGLNIYAFCVSFKQLSRGQPGEGLWKAIRSSKDPRSFSVVLVELGDLIGVTLAFLGVLLGHLLDSGYPDAIAAIAIGLVLASIAVVLANESRHLLIGERADPQVVDDIRSIAEADEAVVGSPRPLTMQLGPDDILLAMGLQFREGLSTDEFERVLGRMERDIRGKQPKVKHIFFRVDSLRGHRDDGQIGSPTWSLNHEHES